MDDIKKFISGFKSFQNKYFNEQPSLFDQLKGRQNPRTMLVGCSDSRVEPALLTGCDPGDIFVVRNVANLVPPCEVDHARHGVSAAIEFAVCDLEVDRIIILGHSGCGGIGRLVEGHFPSESSFIDQWVQIAEPACRDILTELSHCDLPAKTRACEMAAIIVSLKNLMTFPFVAEGVGLGRLSLIGWYFDIQQGALYHFDSITQAFHPLVDSLEPSHSQTTHSK